MLKSTITLKNGVVVNVETDSAEQFMDILNGFGHSVAHTNVYATTHSERIVPAPVKEKALDGEKNPWRENEIIEVAKLIRQYPALTNEQIATRVSSEVIATHGMQSVRNLVARVHRYMLKGTTTGGITKVAVKTLKKNGFGYKREKGRTGGTIVKWSRRDIVEIGKIIRDNIDTKGSMAALVKQYIVKSSDYPQRTDATIYTMSGDIRQYLRTGDESVIGKKFLTVLREAGITPVKHEPTTNFLGNVTRRITVQEA